MWWSVAGRARLTVITCGKQPVDTQQPPDWARMAELGWSECWPVTLETRAPVSPSDRIVTTPYTTHSAGLSAGRQGNSTVECLYFTMAPCIERKHTTLL